MGRYAIEVSYDGSAFNGWQHQSDGRSVQDAVERALHFLGERTAALTGAGRTDAGVHARAQIAHADLQSDWEPRRLLLALNAKLPVAASVIRVARVAGDFHARRSAVRREYRYFIWNASACYPHIRPYVLALPGEYDWTSASAGARLYEGVHDFRAFCRVVECPERAVRTVYRARLYRRGELLIFKVSASAYLTNMVRIMVGNLLEIARGRRDIAWLATLLEGGASRTQSAKTVSPGGLFLWKVIYPPDKDPFRPTYSEYMSR